MHGAQSLYGVTPDLTMFGKVIGGGMPVAAFGGKKEIMDCIAPLGPVYQAGTLSGNPVAVACGLATLKAIQEPGFYDRLSIQNRQTHQRFGSNCQRRRRCFLRTMHRRYVWHLLPPDLSCQLQRSYGMRHRKNSRLSSMPCLITVFTLLQVLSRPVLFPSLMTILS